MLKVLEQLEQHGASSSMLEDVGGKYLSRQYGEAEIRAKIHCEQLRNSDTRIILKRVAGLHATCANILNSLLLIVSEIDQFKSWEVHQTLGFSDWTEFSENVLNLSGQVADALLLAREQIADKDLNHFLQAMIKGYVIPAISSEEKNRPVGKSIKRKSDKVIIRELKARLEWAEFKLGEEIRARKAAEEAAERARAESYREDQRKKAMQVKLKRNLSANQIPKNK